MFPILFPLASSIVAVAGLGFTGAKFHLKSASNSETLDPSLKQASATSGSSENRLKALSISQRA
jgi:hypothetical protein